MAKPLAPEARRWYVVRLGSADGIRTALGVFPGDGPTEAAEAAREYCAGFKTVKHLSGVDSYAETLELTPSNLAKWLAESRAWYARELDHSPIAGVE